MLSAIVSALHVLSVATAIPSVVLRGRVLKGPLDADGLRRLFAADNAWGIAALFLILTGVTRAFGGLEKGASFYLSSHLFYLKMTLFLLVFALEIAPMIAFIRWRRQLRQGGQPNTKRARLYYVLNHIEMVLLVVIVFVASFMARGFGLR